MAGNRKTLEPIILVLSFCIISVIPCFFSMPLSTNGRWIVDLETGQRVKLACVNWPSHMETMLVEGLQEQPLRTIVELLTKQKFNCVRLTYATYMWTRFANRTVSESIDFLPECKQGVAKNNPDIMDKTLVQAYETVVDELAAHGVMTLLDNHVSKPSWCCSESDGNTFFGDIYFDVKEWIQGLTAVTTHFKGKPKVIAVSTRNELRGRLQNKDDWYKYMLEGASAIHVANPDVLVFASGINYATDLSFLRNKTLGTNFDNKLVYDGHWYPWSQGDASKWDVELLNEACHAKTQNFIDRTGFTYALKDDPVPLFVGEFGSDQSGLVRAHDHYFSCFLALAAGIDLDWGLWGLQGSYYIRDNITNSDETFGVLDRQWNSIRNPQYMNRLDFVKDKLIEPSSNSPTSFIMFHPQSGTCVHNNSEKELLAWNCEKSARWRYAGNGSPIMLEGSNLCLQAVGEGYPAILTKNCISQQSSWKLLSDTKLHVATVDKTGKYLCLQKESSLSSRLITSECVMTLSKSVRQSNPVQDLTAQWFKLTSTNV